MKIKRHKNKFYIGKSADDYIAEITFYPTECGEIVVNHTFVGPSLRGQGIAKKLVDRTVEYAREKNLKIVPRCSYVREVMNQDECYKDILA